MNPHEVFIHIRQGCFAGTGAIVRLPQCQWSKPGGYGKISQCITTPKPSKAATVCIFLGIYFTYSAHRERSVNNMAWIWTCVLDAPMHLLTATTTNLLSWNLWNGAITEGGSRNKGLHESLQWRHNECHGVSNPEPLDCLLSHLFKRASKKTSKLRVTYFCVGNPPLTGGFHSQRASNGKNIFHLMTSSWFVHLINIRGVVTHSHTSLSVVFIDSVNGLSPCSALRMN